MTVSAHILTVDVEDWPQSTLDHSLPISDRVVTSTLALMEVLETTGARATFFILGKVAERHPTLAQEIAGAGHEVATHGYSHESVEAMSASRFKDELHRAVDLVAAQTGARVYGHRAADFSISKQRLRFLEYLLQEGLSYDSSIFPIRHPRYGIGGAHRFPHLVRCESGTLVEFPVATAKFGRFVLPGAGGGYFRLFPYWWTQLLVRHLEKSRYPATCYLHPYEIDEREREEIPYHVPITLRLSQFMNRGTVKSKLLRLLKDFRFTTMLEAYRSLELRKLPLGLDLTVWPIRYTNSSEGQRSISTILRARS